MQPRTGRLVARGVGAAAIAFAGVGFWYNGVTLFAYVTGRFDDTVASAAAPYFDAAFLIMSGICIACFVALAWCGVQFLRLSLRWFWLLTGVAIVEIAFTPIVGSMWLHPQYGMSIGAASGVAGAGLMPQLFVLFPIWGPALVWLARRSLVRQ
jgi:hypothetical protein